MTTPESMVVLEKLRAACNVFQTEICPIVGCSHVTYKHLVAGSTNLEDWDQGIERARWVLWTGLSQRVLPIMDVERKKKALHLLLEAYYSADKPIRVAHFLKEAAALSTIY